MLNCIVLGDSLAVGVGHARPECRLAAVSGISSERYVQFFPGIGNVRTAIISLGVNDGESAATAENLTRLRVRISAIRVYWLLTGGNPHAREAIRAVAARFGDRLIDAAPLAGADHIHPDRNGYARLAALTGGTEGNSAVAAARQEFLASTRVQQALPNPKAWNGLIYLNGVPPPGLPINASPRP